jgi:hypothetical protein
MKDLKNLVLKASVAFNSKRDLKRVILTSLPVVAGTGSNETAIFNGSEFLFSFAGFKE